ncbi:DMT family transporter [Aestuariivirga sp. YIM B02566]|uniref:DMT family transporter n=1 Tax=Taklimakanibacter albus TaxID=2800327 RepID=A0ACC5RCX7_9HYPH|nr:DMT family transporter [Aestuariivirga sp. YIM B02566]MBK1870325.1 DMT family transporter [Aestuariivirga sp. YIM B02566]
MSDSSSRQATGILLMTAAMVSIPLVDGIAKYLTATHSPLFVGWARYAVAGLIVLPLAFLRNGRRIFPTERRASHLLRTSFLALSMTLYFLALARIPLATAISAFFIGPIIAVVLSIFILKERMTWPKVTSLALGFIGAIVILRPGAALNPGILLAFGAGLCFGLYLIATRWASQSSDPIKTLAFQCVIGTLLLTPQAALTWTTPQWNEFGFFLCLGLFSAFSHMMSIAAFRFAEASLLAPLVYLELIGAALIGYYAFGEIPDAYTIIGAGFIIAAGLILLKRSRARL